jgi:RND superfamily putative drug exporter
LPNRILPGLVLAAVAALLLFPDRGVPTPTGIRGSESAVVTERLRDEFGSAFARSAVLLFDDLPVPAMSDSGRALVRRVVTPIAAVPGIAAVLSPATLLDTLLHSADGQVAIAVVGYDDPSALAAARRLTDSLATALGGVTLAWTGEAPLLDDLRDATTRAIRRAELLAAPLTLAAAAWAFGAIGSGVMAMLVVAAVIVVGRAALLLLGTWIGVSPIAEAMVVLVGASLGLDYLLWRRRGGYPSRWIRWAALMAAIAFAALLLGPTAEIRSAGIGGLVAIVAATLVTGWWPAAAPGTAHSAASVLTRWAVERPRVVLATAGALLLLLAWRGATVPVARAPDRWLPGGVQSTLALDRLREVGRGAAAAPLTVVVPLSASAWSAEGWDEIRAVAERLRRLDGVADVRAVTGIGTRERQVTRAVVPAAVLANWVSRDAHRTVLQLLVSEPSVEAAAEAVQRVRGALVGSGAEVGGLAAFALDHREAMSAARWPLAGWMVLGTLLALLAAFRAPVIALKAVALNLVTAVASLGVVWLCHPAARLDGVPVTLPLLAIGAAFALSIDYELLLLSAVREARTQGGSEREAILAGVGRATPMLVRGGVMLVSIGLAFAVGGFGPVAMMGTVVLATIVLDITLVRLLIAPAVLVLLGRWNWWPGDRRVAPGPNRW